MPSAPITGARKTYELPVRSTIDWASVEIIPLRSITVASATVAIIATMEFLSWKMVLINTSSIPRADAP